MKIILQIFFILFSQIAYGQIKDPWKGKPNSIEESLQYLNLMFDDTAKFTFMTFPEDIATSRLHHGFGTWIRNNWGLWRTGSLKKQLIDSGFVHPDDMSSALLKAYHRRLNGKKMNLNEEAQAYSAYWSNASKAGFSAGDLGSDHKKNTTVSELMSYFPIGDTVLVNIYATQKKLFQNVGSSLESLAIVTSHSSEKLKVKLLWIEKKEKHVPGRIIGDEFETSPIYCSLIPPPDWSIDGVK